ncbi:glycosyltransferase family 4 protein [Candidatus Woesebacteria bacterium]|nr:glycosyltransferase family 4 protein [Candidatus Woesebacteria bacterium]
MKKRLIISSYDDIKNPTYGGGGATAVYQIAKRLGKVYDVIVYTSTYPGATNLRSGGVEYRRIGTSMFGPKLGQLIFQLCLPFVSLTQKFDLWIESFTPPFSTAFIPLFTSKPVIGLVHMLAAADMERKYKLPFHLIENLGLKVYRSFIVLSQNSKETIKLQNPTARFLVVPNGVDLPVSRPKKSKRDSNYLLFMGRIEVDQKGLDILIASYARIAPKYPLRLKIAGSGNPSEMAQLAMIVAQSGFADRIDILGRVEGVVKEKLYAGSTMVLIPSRYETFSLTALESLSHSIPLVCCDIPGMEWLGQQVAVKAKVGSITSYARSITELLNNPTKYRQMATNSLLIAKKYSWDNVAKEYLSFIGSHL